MFTPPARLLVVTADDFGIGPGTSHGILDLAACGAVTSTVLLVNSPYAEDGVAQWLKAGRQVELGWHPCLTLDAPILSPDAIPSLVDAAGRFLPLGGLLRRLVLGRVVEAEVEKELSAQYRRFLDLVGTPPPNVNGHHHVHVFGPVSRALRRILAEQTPRPFVRRLGEPARTLIRVRGARIKRLVLSRIGRQSTAAQARSGYPGTEHLVGITDPPFVHWDEFFSEWLAATPGRVVELTCHPGYLDATLDGRDGSMTDGQLHRRAREFELLRRPSFMEAIQKAGFALIRAGELNCISGNIPRAA
ncbi:MAG TPA: ChbG/HpnK family deacetylase [Fimbriiglobus sp.]